jgi:hypothetical protein
MTPKSNDGANFSSVQLLTTWLGKNAKRGDLGKYRPEEMGVALAGLAHAFCIQWLAEGSGTSLASQTSRVVSLFLYGAMGTARGAKTSTTSTTSKTSRLPARAANRR